GDLPLSPRMEQAAASHGERPSQRDAEAAMSVASGPEVDPEYNALIKQLRAAVADQPNDIQGHILLAHHEARLGNFRAAAESQARVIDLAGDGVAARDRTDLGELMIAAAGGYVSPEAEQQLNLALQMNPEDGRARYYWGLMRLQTGRPDLAFRVWESTLEQGPPNAPWIIAISGQIEEVARRAGLEYRPPAPVAPAPGPSAEDVAAASELTAQERADMIQGMVEQLSERLTSEGGEPEEWARLIRALGVLGETERAQAAYDESRARFADDPQAEALLITAAEQSGLRP
ncbi:MAG: c-type cytochrome biogenesis protein CcmI, partial [Pseudomonadota bacterium]